MQLTLAEVRWLLTLARKEIIEKVAEIGGYEREKVARKLENEATRLEQAQIAGLVD